MPELDLDCADWVRQAVIVSQVSLIPLSVEIAIERTRLPGHFHGDPADRIIAATARQMSGTLITKDKQIIEYSQQGFVKALAL